MSRTLSAADAVAAIAVSRSARRAVADRAAVIDRVRTAAKAGAPARDAIAFGRGRDEERRDSSGKFASGGSGNGKKQQSRERVRETFRHMTAARKQKMAGSGNNREVGRRETAHRREMARHEREHGESFYGDE